MCGILCVLGNACCSHPLTTKYVEQILIQKLGHRGPNGHQIIGLNNRFILCHTRLSIVGCDNGTQPFKWIDPTNSKHIIYLSVNGEIYNYKQLYNQHFQTDLNFTPQTQSDCEIILHLYNKYKHNETKLKQMLLYLNGMFSFILLDTILDQNNNNVSVSILFARDCIGIKPMYLGHNKQNHSFWISSELKAISPICDYVQYMEAGHYVYHQNISFNNNTMHFIPKRFYKPIYLQNYFANQHNYYLTDNLENILSKLKTLIIESVKLRMMRDENKINIGVFLSGGLDSSLIAGIAAKFTNKLYLFSIGMSDSKDIIAARKVAQHLIKYNQNCEFIYKECILNPSDLYKNNYELLRNCVFTVESFDESLLNASIGNIYLSQLAMNNNCSVILSGEGADELFGGYNYLTSPNYTNNINKYQQELIYSITTMHSLGLNRCDKSSMKFNIEQRVPFLDVKIIDYVMRIHPKYKITEKGYLRKMLLRNVFESDNLIPKDVLFRKKLQFSAGMGANLYRIIKEITNKEITDYDLQYVDDLYPMKTPNNKTQIFYRRVFEEYFGTKSIDTVITWGNESHEKDNKYSMFIDAFVKQSKL
eukprot:314050_1